MRIRAFGFSTMLLTGLAGLWAEPVLKQESQGWPRHRGDAALRGISAEKVGSALKLAWVFDAGDFLKSSVVVSKGIAYVGADTGILHALDLESGKQSWSFKTGLGIEAPPLVSQGLVFAGSTDGFLYALGAEDGKLKWKYETDGEIMGAANQAIRPKSGDS
ncbi:MAG TPA: hypothetical protein DCG39_10600, partial [Opitutae bacterium]|nr:hypothetical protein [Opitutae bacterium]